MIWVVIIDFGPFLYLIFFIVNFYRSSNKEFGSINYSFNFFYIFIGGCLLMIVLNSYDFRDRCMDFIEW